MTVPSRTTTRAQTTIDFAIGIGLFLLVVAFVVSFVPTMFTPFQSAEGPQTADRIATSLATDRLGDPADPYVLNESCTAAFFEQLRSGTDARSTCQYNTTADTTKELFALGATRNVNVSSRTSDGTVAERAGVTHTAGPPVPDTTTVTSARRVVFLGGETHRLLVRTW